MYSPENQPRLNPHPILPIEQMTGADIAEPLAWLAGHMVDSIMVDGHSFTHVGHRHEEHDGRVHTVCIADDGTELLLSFDPTDATEPITHVILPAQN